VYWPEAGGRKHTKEMHKLSTSVAVLEHELSELRVLLERRAGILLEGSCETLSAKIAEFLESRHLNSAPDLLKLIQSRDSECEALLESLLDGETGFFRPPAAFEIFEKKVLPDLHARKSNQSSHPLRIWSAGGSSGEEPYSIAMTVCQTAKVLEGWNIRIVGSDIRPSALAVAERGLYPQQALAHVPSTLIQTYFARIGQHFLAKPRLRNLLTFTKTNLADPGYIGRFDCIFCMDVMRHFSMAQRIALAQRLHLYLEPGGYLFLGQGEKLPGMDVSWHAQTDAGYTVFQKSMASVAKSGR